MIEQIIHDFASRVHQNDILRGFQVYLKVSGKSQTSFRNLFDFFITSEAILTLMLLCII